MRPEPFRVAVLASGSGTNFQALADRFADGSDPRVAVVLLIASRPDAGVLQRAEAREVPTAVLDADREEAFLLEQLDGARPDLVVLAGYLRLIPPRVVRRYWGRMINLHPALLPSFGGQGMYGLRVHRAVLEAGVRVSGATVHFVDERYDRGPIIAQWPVPVLGDDEPGTLARRVTEVEHVLLPRVVRALAGGDVYLSEDGVVRWRREWFEGSRFAIRV